MHLVDFRREAPEKVLPAGVDRVEKPGRILADRRLDGRSIPAAAVSTQPLCNREFHGAAAGGGDCDVDVWPSAGTVTPLAS